MSATITEIAPDLYRLSHFLPDFGIQLNQFLIVDDQPFLMHTGFRHGFDDSLAAVSQLIDPATLRWIGFSHFESDECGALNPWLAAAPQAEPLCSVVGAMVMVNDFADRPPRALADGDTVDLGRHRLRFLATPHLPHGWDAGLFFEEHERTLLCSDLFFHPGDPEPLIEHGLLERARAAIIEGQGGPLAGDLPYTANTEPQLQRLAALQPQSLALMHGSSFRGDGGAALRQLATLLRETIGPD